MSEQEPATLVEMPQANLSREASPQEAVQDGASRLQELEATVERMGALLKEKDAALEQLSQRAAAAVSRYRDAVLAALPGVPAELVSGESVEEIEAAAAVARKLVDKVRRQLEEQASKERIPPGAPVRAGETWASLSPQEKILRGLRRSG